MWSTSFSPHERVAQFLSCARARTVQEGDELLHGLSSFREAIQTVVGGKEITLSTVDGDLINGLYFQGTLPKAIIFLHGNAGFYETTVQRPFLWLEDLTVVAPDGTKNVPHLLVFNPRGTGKSTGVTHPDAVAQDLLTAFDYLVTEASVDPSHIAIIGHSMGGFFAALGAALIQRKYPNSLIHCISDRSFAEIHSRSDLAMERSGHSRMVRAILTTAYRTLIAQLHWDRDPLAALETLKGRVCVISHSGDSIVPYDTSLLAAMMRSEQRIRSYTYLLMHNSASDSVLMAAAHNNELESTMYLQMIQEIKHMLELPLNEALDPLPTLSQSLRTV